jgi:predicted dehydrogenase
MKPLSKLRVAVVGVRHGHIMDVIAGVRESADFELVACCEEDAATREALAREGKVTVTHTRFADLLDTVDCDVIAVGDYYGRRGAIATAALASGRHVISDKPICTRLDELEEIARLCAAHGLAVGCQLDMRDNGLFIRMRELVREGAMGEVHAITIGGQHPLLPESRPAWYFEPGKHGGTINDIGIHAFDCIPWITGLDCAEIIAARSWNALAKDTPFMHDAGQFMVRMSNGAGLLGDVSYLMPGAMGYSLEPYWRTTLWGSKGVIETSLKMGHVLLMTTADQQCRRIEPVPAARRGYLQAFLNEIRGVGAPGMLTSHDVIAASRFALQVQAAGCAGGECVRV